MEERVEKTRLSVSDIGEHYLKLREINTPSYNIGKMLNDFIITHAELEPGQDGKMCYKIDSQNDCEPERE
jgi:hypothetical protein